MTTGGLKLRNATLTTIAPTGTLSLWRTAQAALSHYLPCIILGKHWRGWSSNDGSSLPRDREEEGFMSEPLVQNLERGRLHELREVRESVRDFYYSFEVPGLHVKIQAGFRSSRIMPYPKRLISLVRRLERSARGFLNGLSREVQRDYDLSQWKQGRPGPRM